MKYGVIPAKEADMLERYTVQSGKETNGLIFAIKDKNRKKYQRKLILG